MSTSLERRSVKGMGWKPDLPDLRDLPYSAPHHVLRALPTKVDQRTEVFAVPPIYDQLRFSSCTANGIAFAAEYEQRRQGLVDFMPSRMFIYWNERDIEGDTSADNGAYIRDGFRALGKLGVCPEDLWPYDAAHLLTKPSAEAFAAATKHQATRYHRVQQTSAQIKSCLAEGYPIVFGASLYQSFEQIGSDGLVPMPSASEAMLGGHCMVIVGYDDQGRYIWRNSWGTSWGDKGYCYAPEAYVLERALVSDLWALVSVEV